MELTVAILGLAAALLELVSAVVSIVAITLQTKRQKDDRRS